MTAGGDSTGAGLNHHHLMLDQSALGAAENQPNCPGVGGAAAASLWTGESTELGAVGSEAPAALVLQGE